MTRLQYDDALDALREVAPPSPERAAAARAAILRGLTQGSTRVSSPRRGRPFATALLLAAALGGTAFASTAALRWRARTQPAPTDTTQRISSPNTAHPALRAAPPAARAARAAPVAPPSVNEAPTRAIAVAPVDPPRAASVVTAPRATTTVRPTTLREAPIAVLASAAREAPAQQSAASLYTAAHQAHFSQRDYTTALARWDAYIASTPQGHFLPEAQFNRIVCLVRLDRREDAIASIRALPASHYRRVEAERLLERLTTP
jgi:hypothetical protein